MDIKAKIEEIAAKVKADPDFLKAKISANNVKAMLGGFFGAKK